MNATIWHNPNCSKSRDALRFLSDAGHDVTVVLYQDAGLTIEALERLMDGAGISASTLLRPDAQKGLEAADTAEVLAHLIAHPESLERPFVQTERGIRLARPIEALVDIVDPLPPSPWMTEKGELVL